MRRQYKTAKGGGGRDDMLNTYFFVEDASGADNTLQIKKRNSSTTTITFEYSYDQANWSEPIETSTTATAITIPANGRIYLRVVNGVFGGTYPNDIGASRVFNIGGNLFSLLYGQDFLEYTETETRFAFSHFFQGNTRIISAELLRLPPMTHVPAYCFEGLFQNSSIQKLPERFLDKVKSVEEGSFKSTFDSCKNLQKIPDGIFSQIENVASSGFANCFKNCSAITELPDGMFAILEYAGHCSTTFGNMLSGCSSLVTLSKGMFSKFKGFTGGSYQFTSFCDSASSLVYLPEGMFGQYTVAWQYEFMNAFSNCVSLKTLPNGMFSILETANASAFRFFCYNSKGLTQLPDGIFSRVYKYGSYSFAYCFQDTSLQAIPNNMFSNLYPSTTDSAFRFCFCRTLITEIPADLFSTVTSCDGYAFSSVFNRTPIEEGLDIRQMTSVLGNSFLQAYANCANIKVIYAPNISTWSEVVFDRWVQGVGSVGTFYKPKGLEIPVGESGIPEGWTVVEYE